MQTEEVIHKRSATAYNEQNSAHRPATSYQKINFSLKPNEYGITKPTLTRTQTATTLFIRPSTSVQRVSIIMIKMN